MENKFWGAILLTGLVLLLAVVGAEASVIIDVDGPAGTSPSAPFSPLAAAVTATGCVDGTNSWVGPGQTIGTNYGNKSAYVIYAHIPSTNSSKTPTFCTDLVTGIGKGVCFQAAGPTACPITWLLNNGYGPASSLSNAEAAARQAAVWYFSDGLRVKASDAVYARTQKIIAAVPIPCTLPTSAPMLSLSPSSATTLLPGGETHFLTVSVTRGGVPLAGQSVNLQTTFGTLSAATITTGADGAATFSVAAADSGTATITAKLTYALPAGTRLTALPGAPDQQVLVLGTSQTGDVIATANVTWQASSIVVHKFHDENLNQVQDGAEASLSGWAMKLQRLTGSDPDVWDDVATLTTDANGNAIFSPLAAGTYRAVETMQSDWQASTSNPSVPIVLPANGAGQINFGNFRLPAIKVWKFHDLNGNGGREPDEPTLDGWQMNIEPAVNGIGSCTTAAGFCAFENLSTGPNVVSETMQPGWSSTTGSSKIINVTAGSVSEVWIGNLPNAPTTIRLAGFSARGRVPWGGLALLGAVLFGLAVLQRRRRR
jgi:hypothetical protein